MTTLLNKLEIFWGMGTCILVTAALHHHIHPLTHTYMYTHHIHSHWPGRLAAVWLQAGLCPEKEDEEVQWEQKLVGDHNPETLLNAMVYMNKLYSALHSGSEHWQLCHSPCQIQIIENPGERSYLCYTEDTSNGGLKGRRQKVVIHLSNVDHPTWCFVRLFKLCNQLCPMDCSSHAFYLAPLKQGIVGFHVHHWATIHSKTLLETYKKAGIKGYKANHSASHSSDSVIVEVPAFVFLVGVCSH